jgi:hypothetical protein
VGASVLVALVPCRPIGATEPPGVLDRGARDRKRHVDDLFTRLGDGLARLGGDPPADLFRPFHDGIYGGRQDTSPLGDSRSGPGDLRLFGSCYSCVDLPLGRVSDGRDDVACFDLDGCRRIDAAERAAGTELGRPRDRFIDRAEMLRAAAALP